MIGKPTHLGDVLALVERSVPVEQMVEYRFVGVRSFGGGCFDAGVKQGSKTRYQSLRRVEADDFVYPKLMAWEGAFAVVSHEFAGFHVSPEFCTFRANPARVDIRYLGYLFQRPQTWDDIAASSIGTNLRRRRLYPQEFLAKEISLPDLDEQRRVADKLNLMLTRLTGVEEGRTKSAALARGVLASLVDGPGASVEVGELLTQVERHKPIDPEREYALLGVRWYGEGLFVRERRRGNEIAGSQLQRLQAGDFVYNRLFAWKGSFALVRPEHDGAHVSNEFPAFRVDETRVLPEYLLAYYRTPPVWTDALGRSTGGTPTSRNRLKEDRFLKMSIPLPPIQRQMVQVGRIRAIDDVRARRESQTPLIGALSRSVLNRAFSGEL